MFTQSDRSADGETIMRGAPGFDSGDSDTQYQDPFDDVFGSAPASPTGRTNDADELSDIPRLRSIHVTNGYREGISAGKETSIQAGFDEGYALGAEYGHLAAWIQGVIQALLSVPGADIVSLEALSAQAKIELALESLFSTTYFDEDGIWTYEVQGGSEDTTFRLVAGAHPLLVKWKKVAIDEAGKLKLVIS